MKNDIIQGFAEFQKILDELGIKIKDKKVEKEILKAGAKPIIKSARQLMNRHRSTGNLQAGLKFKYNTDQQDVSIGYTKGIGFYGRFHDHGWRPATGRREGRRGRFTQTSHARRKTDVALRSGMIRNQHIYPAYQREKQAVASAMIKKYKKLIG